MKIPLAANMHTTYMHVCVCACIFLVLFVYDEGIKGFYLASPPKRAENSANPISRGRCQGHHRSIDRSLAGP